MIKGDTSLAFAIGLTRWWTRVYTARMPDAARVRRRCDIEADLWDLVDDFGSTDRTAPQIAAHILARCVLGIADDLAWRVDQAPWRTSRALTWAGAAAIFVAAAAAWLAAATRIELPSPAPIMAFVEASPPPPRPPDLR